MKKILLVIVALLCVFSASALRPEVWLSGFQASPEVGKDFNLSVTLVNLQPNTCANNIIMSIQGSYPFIMKGISTIPVGSICGDKSITAVVPLKIDPTATGGFYQLTVNTDYETSTLAQFTSSSTINLFVAGSPDISAQVISASPLDIYPGDTATVTVAIQNDGTFEAQSVSADMTAQSPLEMIWSKSSDSLGLLGAKQGMTSDFTIDVPKDAPSGDYNLQLKVDYLDEDLRRMERVFSFDMVVKGKAMFEAEKTSSDTFYKNQNNRHASYMIKNTGTDVAKRVKVKVMPMYPFSTDGSVRYIDSLQPGQETEVQFTLNTDKDATPGTYALDLLVDFEDEQGKSFEDTSTEISVDIAKESFFRAVFIDYWYLWIIALVLVFIIAMRRMQKRKKSK